MTTPTSTDTKIREILLKIKAFCEGCEDCDNDVTTAETALKTLITSEKNKARIDELEKIMNGQKTIRSYITSDGGEEQIVTYEFANTEIKDRLTQLREME